MNLILNIKKSYLKKAYFKGTFMRKIVLMYIESILLDTFNFIVK
jgi:hypothetical protein